MWAPGSGGHLSAREKHSRATTIIRYCQKHRGNLPEPEQPVILRKLLWLYVYARPEQICPTDVPDIWFLLGGRGCVAAGTIIEDPYGRPGTKVEDWLGGPVLAREETGEWVVATAGPSFLKGSAPLFRVSTDAADEIVVTDQHRFLTPSGWKHLADIAVGELIASPGQSAWPSGAQRPTKWSRITAVEAEGEGDYYDLTVPGPACYVANGLLNHNSGKTRGGSEKLYEWAQEFPKTRWACVAPTLGAARAVMFEGDSGLLNVIPEVAMFGRSRILAYNSGRVTLRLANGSIIQAYSSEKPGILRGPQQHGYWIDEPAELKDAFRLPLDIDTTFSNLTLGTRLTAPGFTTRGIITGTPKPCKLLVGDSQNPGLLTGFEDLTVVIDRMSSRDNLGNLTPAYRKLVDRLDGTRIGRQEIEAELLTDVVGAGWKQEWISIDRNPPEEWQSIAIGVDPAGTNRETSDETGIVVTGLDLDGVLWVLDDLSDRYTPGQWAQAAYDAFVKWDADAIAVETNFGADMVKDTLLRHTNAPESAIVEVRASRGKTVRAQPISFIYEPTDEHPPGSRAKHRTHFPQLVDEMTMFTGAKGQKSPGRLDALVWSAYYVTRLGLSDDSELEGLLEGILPRGKY